MNSRKKEMKSLFYLRDTLETIDCVETYFSDNDKEPSWDGNIKIYLTDQCKVEELIKQVSVQVKGTTAFPLNKDWITYPIRIADLNNYINDTGCIYFVVALEDDLLSKEFTIYYSALTPIKIRNILKGKKDPDQEKISVRLRPFPQKPKMMLEKLMAIASNFKFQGNITSSHKLKTLDELLSNSPNEQFTFHIPALRHPALQDDYILNSGEMAPYIKNQGSDIWEPLDDEIVFMREIKQGNVNVSVNGQVFYNRIEIIGPDESMQINIGNCCWLNRVPGKNAFESTFRTSNKMNTVLADSEFLCTLFNSEQMELNGIPLSFTVYNEARKKFNPEKEMERLSYIKKVKELMLSFGYTGDLDFSKFSTQDNQNLDLLVRTILEKKSVKHTAKPDSLTTITVFGMKFLVLPQQDKENPDNVFFENFFDSQIQLAKDDVDGYRYPVSNYVALTTFDLMDVVNLDLNKAVESFKTIPQNNLNFCEANNFSLGLISLADSKNKNNQEYLRAASDLLDWINDNDSDFGKEIMLFNKLQIKKRLGELTKDEEFELLEIAESKNSPEDWKVAANILLSNFKSAEFHLRKLAEEERSIFYKYPISNLLPAQYRI